jgi:hypothetical protein
MEVPDHLKSSIRLLGAAFPEGLHEDCYMPLLAFLYDEFSDRNLAELVSKFTGKDYYVVLNDIAKSQSSEKPSAELLNKVRWMLMAHGYETWKQEE